MVAAERGPVEGVIPALTGFAGFWPRDAKGWRADVPHFVTPGLTRGPAFLLGPRPAQGSGTPDQVRGDGKLVTAIGHLRPNPFPLIHHHAAFARALELAA